MSKESRLTVNQLILLLQYCRGRRLEDMAADPATVIGDTVLLQNAGLLIVPGEIAGQVRSPRDLVTQLGEQFIYRLKRTPLHPGEMHPDGVTVHPIAPSTIASIRNEGFADLCRRLRDNDDAANQMLSDLNEIADSISPKAAEPAPQKQTPGLFVDGNATIVLGYVVGVTTGGHSASESSPASSDTDVHMLSGSANITESATPAFLEALRMHHGMASSPTVGSGVRVVLRDDRSKTGDPAAYQNADRGDTPGLVKAAHAERDRHRDRADHAMRILSTLLGQAAVAKIKLNTPIGYNGADDEDPVEN